MRFRWAKPGFVVFVALVMVATPMPAMASVSVAFTTSAENWKVYQRGADIPQFPQAGVGDPTHSTTGGNPGGFISKADAGDDTGLNFADPTLSGDFMFFDSSNSGGTPWADNHSENNLGTFSVDLRSSVTGTRGAYVELYTYGYGFLVAEDFASPGPAANTWTTYTFSFDATQGDWLYCAPGTGSCPPATQNDILTVLTYLSRVLVFGDTQPGTGEVVSIDNPSISGGTPPPDGDADGTPDAIDTCPAEVGTVGSGCAATRTLTLRRSRSTFSGVLVADGPYSEEPCQMERTVRIFRKQPGPDKLIATATTAYDDPSTAADESGSFSVRKRAKTGKYYGRVDAETLTVNGKPHGCAAATSNTVRVR